VPGIGAKTAARLINQHGHIEQFPAEVLRDNYQHAIVFKNLATLRVDAPLFKDVDQLRWNSPRNLVSLSDKIGDTRVADRIRALEALQN
jgi:5'-3' exonuclease